MISDKHIIITITMMMMMMMMIIIIIDTHCPLLPHEGGPVARPLQATGCDLDDADACVSVRERGSDPKGVGSLRYCLIFIDNSACQVPTCAVAA